LYTGSQQPKHSTSSPTTQAPNLRTYPATTPPSCFSLLPFTTPNIYSIRATLPPPHTLPRPPHALYHTSLVPACPCPTHRPSCDSTTIRLTTPTLPLRRITSFFPFVTNPPSLNAAQRRRAYIHHRLTLLVNPPSIEPPSSQPFRVQSNNRPSRDQPLSAGNDRPKTTTYARIELVESVENQIVNAPTRSAPTR
jgi:hypothetical protein